MKYSILILLIIGIWTGLVFGISFLEAPLKFTAPGMTTKIALGLGRIIFDYSNKVQLFLSIILVGGFLVNFSTWNDNLKILIGLIILIMAIQNLWLLPSLDQRVIQILKGGNPKASSLHMYFVVTEVIKLGLLVLLFYKLYFYENFRF